MLKRCQNCFTTPTVNWMLKDCRSLRGRAEVPCAGCGWTCGGHVQSCKVSALHVSVVRDWGYFFPTLPTLPTLQLFQDSEEDALEDTEDWWRCESPWWGCCLALEASKLWLHRLHIGTLGGEEFGIWAASQLSMKAYESDGSRLWQEDQGHGNSTGGCGMFG